MPLLLSIITALIFSTSVTLGQCIDRQRITYGGDYKFIKFIHLCPTYRFSFGGDTSTNWNVLTNPIDIRQAPEEVFIYKQKIEKEIREFAGDAFYSKVKFSSVEVVYPERLKAFIDSGRPNMTLNYCKAKYFYYYSFDPDTIATYHIGVAVDEKGKIISEFNFPSKSKYRSIPHEINYCKLIELAKKSQPEIKFPTVVKLEFDDKGKRFYWVVSEEKMNFDESRMVSYDVWIDASELKLIKNKVRNIIVDF